MTQRKRNPYAYARTFLYQTDGSAALQEQSVLHMPNHEKPQAVQKKSFRLSIPVWGILLAASIAVFFFMFRLLSMSSAATNIQKQIFELQQEEKHAREIIESLEVQLSAAEAPSRIHSIAVNKLGMHRPTEDEIIYIPFMDDAGSAETVENPRSEEGILQYLLGLFGL